MPWDKNPRGIKTKDFERLKKQILRLGVYKPLVVYEDGGKYIVLGGNMRIRALKDLGIKDVDISIVEPKSEAQKIEYALSDNDRAGYYEEEKLAELVYPEIKNLDLTEIKIDLGEALDLKQVVERFGPDIDDGADDVPEVDDTPAITKAGDLFTLGKHRLMCGDSTKAEDVARLMKGEKAGLCFSSPPYFNQREYSQWKTYEDYLTFAGLIVKALPLASDAIVGWNIGSDEQAHRWMPADWWTLFRDDGWMYQESFAWVKAAAVWSVPRSMHIENGKYFPALRWEIILTVKRGKHPSFDMADRDRVRSFQDNVWQTAVVSGTEQKKTGHPAMFPTELPDRFITAYSMKGALSFDPFLGSGTTLIAAEKTGRVCYGMEIDPKYCDVIIKRYADYVGVPEENIRATRENPNE